jgi:4-hydroxy-3-methylbut-2-enyl diphosphate reductase
MIIDVDKESGFCPGVVSAISKAEDRLRAAGSLYCLGDIVHNSQEVQRLCDQGLVTIEHDEFARLHGATVLLRAHGEPPETYETARRNEITIIDATCPVVLQLQKKIRRCYESLGAGGGQIVIYGKRGHAEVNGLVGQTDGTAIVVDSPERLSQIDFTRPVVLFSQTTMAVDHFRRLADDIRSRMAHPEEFQCFDTICRQVSNRIPHVRTFAACHDVIFLVSGKKSSNGKALFDECLAVNPRSHFVDHPEEVSAEMLRGAKSVGICGATSTPRWQMEQIGRHIALISGTITPLDSEKSL